MSADYVIRLEQGRAAHPSPQVLDALARTLRLSADERAHLYRVAGRREPGPGRMRRHLTPGLQRILDRLADVPVLVLDAAGTIVAWNGHAAALVGDPGDRRGRERNVPWMHFTGAASRVVRDAADDAAFEAEMVGDLHAALGRHPEDPELRELIADLRAASPRFRELWEQRPAAVRSAGRKTFAHPAVGRVTVDCDVLFVHGTDLRVMVYTAEPGSADADALALIGVVGLQELGAAVSPER